MATNDERPLSGDEEEGSGQVPQDAGIFGRGESAIETPSEELIPALSVAAFLESSKAVTRSAYVCMDGTLEEELERLIEEYDSLTDLEGNPVAADGDEPSLADKDHVRDLKLRINRQHARIRAETRRVRFRRMPGDEFEVLEQRYRMSNGRIPSDKLARFATECIVACAIEPPLTTEEVASLRHSMSKGQIRQLDDAAYKVNEEGGTSIPKLPDYLSAPMQPEF